MLERCTEIIDRLIDERKKKGMTQKDLASAAALAQSAIARLESKKATPQLDTLLKVAHALGCDLEVVTLSTEEDFTVTLLDGCQRS